MTGLIALLFVAAIFFIAPLLSALMGAFSGWVVGWFFSDTILGFMAQVGVTDIEMWQLGMALGFVGGFFRSSLSTKKD